MNVSELQNHLNESGENYTLKTNNELIDIISDFGIGETEFHTADISRLIDQNKELIEKIDEVRGENKRLRRYLNEY